DEAGDDRQHDHQARLEIEQPKVARAGQVVDDQLDEDRIDDADGGGDQDCDTDDRQPALVRPEEADDPAECLSTGVRPTGEVRLRATPVSTTPSAHHLGSPQSSRMERNAWAE